MQTANKYLAVENLGLLQRQAGVDPELAELVCACARLFSDSQKPWRFYGDGVTPAELEHDFLCGWLAEKNPQMDPRLMEFFLRYSRIMAARRLPVIFTVGHFARKLATSERHIRWISRNPRRFYKEFSFPKPGGEARVILAPEGKLLTLQRWILRHILDHARPHKYAHGFVRGRSILGNARPHVGREVVIRLDLKDFFPSITHDRVRKVFQRLGYPYRVAVLLTNLCTVAGRLPQGTPTSPALSNLVFLRTDRRFEGLARKMKFRYSRYADDLVFSSNNPRLPCLLPLFRQIVREEGFTVNEDKVRIMRRGQRQQVTGLVLNRKPNLRREQLRLLRAAVHRLQTRGPQAVRLPSRQRGEHDPEYVLRGHLAFLRMVNPEQGAALAVDFPA